MTALSASINTGVRRDFSFRSATVTSTLDIPSTPDITLIPIGPPGQIFYEVASQDLYYSTGSSWERVESSDIFTTEPVDYIIVGAGASGCACARELSSTTTSVLLLDQSVISSYFSGEVFDATVASQTSLLSTPKFSSTSQSPYLGSSAQFSSLGYSSGRVLGGRTSHLPMQWVRGSPTVYDGWATLLSDPAWSYANLLPLILQYERYEPTGTIADLTQRGAPSSSSTSGLICCVQNPPLTDSFSAALSTALSVPQIQDYNDHYQIAGVYQNLVGVSAEQLYNTPAPGSQRSDAYGGFLIGVNTPSMVIAPIIVQDTAPNTDNSILRGTLGRKLIVKTSATVTRVLFAGTKAVGVEFLTQGTHSTTSSVVFAKKGVILSAGAISSPTILQNSGVGDPFVLGTAGIEVIIANQNVGNNLTCHYGPSGVVDQLGLTSPPAGQLNTAFWDLGAPPVERRLQIDYVFPGNSSIGCLSPQVLSALGLTSAANTVSVPGYLLNPQSRGTVLVTSSNVNTPPTVNFNLYSDGSYLIPGTDAYEAVVYLKKLQDIAAAEGGVPANVRFPTNAHYPAPWGPAPDDSLLFEAASSMVSIKPGSACGTLRMGVDALHGVVDSGLKVFGASNLYVADASVMPSIPSGDVTFACILIGLRMAQILNV